MSDAAHTPLQGPPTWFILVSNAIAAADEDPNDERWPYQVAIDILREHGYTIAVAGEPSDEYYEGVKDGIRAHATISGGELLVGALRKPISQVFEQVDEYRARGEYWRFGGSIEPFEDTDG